MQSTETPKNAGIKKQNKAVRFNTKSRIMQSLECNQLKHQLKHKNIETKSKIIIFRADILLGHLGSIEQTSSNNK